MTTIPPPHGDGQSDTPSRGNPLWVVPAISAFVTLGWAAIYADGWAPWVRLELSLITIAALAVLVIWALSRRKLG